RRQHQMSSDQPLRPLEPTAPEPPPGEVVPGTPAAVPEDPRVGIEDFLKLDIRAARIVAAERVPKSRKLMKLEVDLGTERRTLVAGIAEAYEPDGLVGRVVAIIVNLKPATLMGIESNGMILAASAPGGLPILIGFDKEPPLGARVK
ncbi:MAG: methionine--tRNA ligase subunit beta, partial [Acidobacteria bacterium]|nr:methionine--tRNA ligase subunit beta [Acidobacteriota bacterium]